ncbi:hypothetical protein [Mucilaginibacter sp. CSA2-8R]|uniref:hypothetical protein n=1 Tax=Mucilaginibacter sp. CSA2-8R TaxID=3141542 RepID=UPI00315C66CB
MKKLNYVMLIGLVMSLSSCEAIGTIFKAGAYTAIIGIVIVVALIWWILSMFRGGGSNNV